MSCSHCSRIGGVIVVITRECGRTVDAMDSERYVHVFVCVSVCVFVVLMFVCGVM